MVRRGHSKKGTRESKIHPYLTLSSLSSTLFWEKIRLIVPRILEQIVKHLLQTLSSTETTLVCSKKENHPCRLQRFFLENLLRRDL